MQVAETVTCLLCFDPFALLSRFRAAFSDRDRWRE